MRRWLIVGGLVAGGLLGALWFAGRARVETGQGAREPVAIVGAGPRRYAFTLEYATTAKVGGGAQALEVAGRLTAAGELDLRDEDGAQVLAFARISSADWTVFGQPVPEPAEVLLKAVARVALVGGDVAQVRFDERSPRPAAQVLAILARQIQGPPRARVVELDTGFGRAATTFTTTCEGNRCVSRSARGFADYRAFTFVPGPQWTATEGAAAGERTFVDGALVAADVREDLRVRGGAGGEARVTFRATLGVSGPAPAGPPAPVWVALERLPEDARRNALKQRAGTLTVDRMVEDLVRDGAGGEMPRHEAWLWQATGLLRSNPALAGELVRRVREAGLPARAQALVLDVLAQAGTPEAQAAMRDLLGDPKLDAATRAQLHQRFLLVPHPDEATLDFLADSFRAASGSDRRPIANALGAALGHAGGAAQGDRVRLLADALAVAREPTETRALLMAAGNTGSADVLARVLERLGSPEPAIRAAAASALQHMDVPGARDALLGALATEAVPPVQRELLDSLAHHALDAPACARLAAALATAPMDDRTVSWVLELVQRRLGVTPAAGLRAVLLAVRARAVAAGPTAHRLEELIARVGR